MKPVAETPSRAVGALTEAWADSALQQAREHERARMSAELHDGVMPWLLAIAMRLDAMDAPAGSDAAERGALREAARMALAEGRAAVAAWRAPPPAEFADRIALLCALFDRPGVVRCRFIARVRRRLAPTPVLRELQLFAQEGLANAIQHARARRVVVLLHERAGQLSLTIADDGVGVPEFGRERAGGFANMLERAHRLGAQFAHRARPRRGTAVSITLSLGSVREPERVAR